MCNLSQGVLKRGIQEGIQIGRQEALQEGIQIGTDQALLSAVQSLMETTHWTAEQAMTALKIPPEEHGMYHERLNTEQTESALCGSSA